MIVEIERFIATVDRGSFTKASEMLYLTQPALSLSIARLEKQVGAKLFKRIGKRLGNPTLMSQAITSLADIHREN